MINYYVELGLDPSLDDEQIEQKLRQLKKKWAPRASSAPTLEVRQKAERMLELLNEASRILCNKRDREDYDRKLNREKNKQTAPTINTPTESKSPAPTGTGAEAMIGMLESLYEREMYDQALQMATQVLASGVDDSRVYLIMAMCYAENSDFQRSYDTMSVAVQKTQNPDLKAQLIELCLHVYKMRPQARALLDEMMRDYPDTNMLVAWDAECDLYDGNKAMAEEKIADYHNTYPDDRKFMDEAGEAYTWYADTFLTEHSSGGVYIADQEAMDNFLANCRRAAELSQQPNVKKKLEAAEALNAKTFNRDNIGGLFISVVMTLVLLPTIIGAIIFAAIDFLLIRYSLIPNWMIQRTDFTESYDGPYKLAHIICVIFWGWAEWSWRIAMGIIDFCFRLVFSAA